MRANVVQVEFFYAADAKKPKTTVRFYDVHRVLTRIALGAKSLRKQHIELLDIVDKATAWRRWLLSRKSRRLVRRLANARKTAVQMAISLMKETVYAGDVIAIEQHDRSFQLVLNNEIGALFAAISQAEDVWIFVFGPGELLAEQGAPIASIM